MKKLLLILSMSIFTVFLTIDSNAQSKVLERKKFDSGTVIFGYKTTSSEFAFVVKNQTSETITVEINGASVQKKDGSWITPRTIKLNKIPPGRTKKKPYKYPNTGKYKYSSWKAYKH